MQAWECSKNLSSSIGVAHGKRRNGGLRRFQMNRRESLNCASNFSLSVSYKVEGNCRARHVLGSPHETFETAFERCGEMYGRIIDNRNVLPMLLVSD